MKKLLRLALLAGLLMVAPVASNVTPAFAFGSCGNIDGGACSPEGRTLSCSWEGDPPSPGMCWCTDGLWACY
jgi:hypothetical protein